MIRFKCPCGQPLTADMDEAGSSLQCPRCKRLLDVPTLDDLPNLNEDGTYAMGDIELSSPQKSSRRSMPSIHSSGGDLRPTAEDILKVGVPTQDTGPTRPRYDPFTGELVRPMEVTETPLTAELVGVGSPQKSRKSLGYSNEGWKRESFFLPIVTLLSPANLIVLGTMLAVHLVVLPFVAFFPVNVILAIFFGPPLMMILLSHYANIVDTTGPEGNNELPILLRGASMSTDVWHPFTQMMFSLMLVIVPGLIVAKLGLWTPVGWLCGMGTMAVLLTLFPAILLTATTSGTFWNLSPGRLLGTIRACGFNYVFTVAVCLAAFVIYPVGLFLAIIAMTRLVMVAFLGMPSTSVASFVPNLGIVQDLLGWLLLALGIYLLHLTCYLLGMHYRRHHEAFPWMLQRHISTRSDTARKLEESRRQRALARGRAAAETLPPA